MSMCTLALQLHKVLSKMNREIFYEGAAESFSMRRLGEGNKESAASIQITA